MNLTKSIAVTLLTVLVVSVIATSIFVYNQYHQDAEKKIFFGVTYGQNTVDEAKILIDKVKNYKDY